MVASLMKGRAARPCDAPIRTSTMHKTKSNRADMAANWAPNAGRGSGIHATAAATISQLKKATQNIFACWLTAAPVERGTRLSTSATLPTKAKPTRASVDASCGSASARAALARAKSGTTTFQKLIQILGVPTRKKQPKQKPVAPKRTLSAMG